MGKKKDTNKHKQEELELKKQKLYNDITDSFNLLEKSVYTLKNEIKSKDFNLFIRSIYVFTCYEEALKKIQRYIIDKVVKYNFETLEEDLSELCSFVHLCDFTLFRYNESIDDSTDMVHEISHTLFTMLMSYTDYLEELIDEFCSEVDESKVDVS